MSIFRFHPRGRRLPAAVSLLFHLLVVGLLPVADAYLEGAPEPEIHLHAQNEPCAPVHDHLTCRICRVLDPRGALPGAATAVDAFATRAAVSMRPDRSEPPPNAPVSSRRSRAPPSA